MAWKLACPPAGIELNPWSKGGKGKCVIDFIALAVHLAGSRGHYMIFDVILYYIILYFKLYYTHRDTYTLTSHFNRNICT